MKERKVLKNYTLSGTVLIPDIDFTNCDFVRIILKIQLKLKQMRD